ncbi:MAG: response regulator [Roseburia sp.]|nr:response regulator [Roseburia sp.]
MGNQVVWQERFNIGVEVIDKEHKKLFGILNRLFSSRDEEAKYQWVCQEGIKYFKEHALKHFTEEEAYMASINYINFDMHRRLHDNFRRKTLPALERELREQNFSKEAIEHFLGVCAGWLIGHTLTEDRAITGKIESKWVDLLPEEAQLLMTQTILQLLQDMFQLEPRLVSDSYGGEQFGKGVYYRLVYGTQNGDRWELFLVFEEKFIINTVGGIIESEYDTMSVMTMNAARYISRQFAERIREHFMAGELYEMREENLLTYEQFQRVFEHNNPQFSLLFDTKEGYFAFCVIAPHLLDYEGGVPIKTENAMAEVKKYIRQCGGAEKKKILLVDDAEFVRKAMGNLLGDTYDITEANSGMAAIRCITLNRPDLILLDYEMPVCDGSQVLEMIRSEADFADIPVIFLTGRVDAESVKKVIALKPAGYFAKTLKPAEIKQGIDEYFRKAGALNAQPR